MTGDCWWTFDDDTNTLTIGDFGTDGEYNMEWWFDNDSHTLFIAPINDDQAASMDDYDFTANAPWSGEGKKAPWAYLGDKINIVTISNGVTEIAVVDTGDFDTHEDLQDKKPLFLYYSDSE